MKALDESILQRVEPFGDLEGPALLQLAGTCREHRCQTGDTVFRRGDPPTALYIVVEGAVSQFRDEIGKPERLLSRHGPADFFGELGLFDEGPRRATARATEPTRLLEIPRDPLLTLLEGHPATALRLHMIAARRHSANVAAMLGQSPREEVRIRVHREVDLELPDGSQHRSILENLSPGGLSLRTVPAQWRPGQRVELKLVIDDHQLEVTGRITWRSGEAVGLTFVDPAPDHGDRIQRALRILLERAG